MRELPDGWFLRELLAKGLTGETEINRVIACLQRFSESETPSAEIEQWGEAEASDARLEDFEKLSAGYEAPSEVADLIRVSTADGVLDTVRALLLCLAEKQSVTWPS